MRYCRISGLPQVVFCFLRNLCCASIRSKFLQDLGRVVDEPGANFRMALAMSRPDMASGECNRVSQSLEALEDYDASLYSQQQNSWVEGRP